MRRRRRQLGLESLERRELFSINLVGTELQVIGTSGDDRAEVWQSPDRIVAELNGERQSWRASEVESILFRGFEGDDTFTHSTNLPSTAYGHEGFDRLFGGTGIDSLYGGQGDDRLDGGAGNDLIRGGDGNDSLEGGEDNDHIYGGNGDDELYGQEGHDSLYGGAGDDLLHGQLGIDWLYAGPGNDYAWGGDDVDYLYGDNGDDWLYGERDQDYLTGGNGHDVLYGNRGDDAIYGDSGNDHLYGGDGADRCNGGDGSDTIHGENGPDELSGGRGHDELHGNSGSDTIYGDAGHDYLYAGDGADRCYGGDGNDTFVSLDAKGTDDLFGQNDYDSFWTDQADTVGDADSDENATSVHRIRSFGNGADRTLDGDEIADPTDGLFYDDFGDQPLFASTGPSEDDIDQNALGDCWLLATMGAVARTSQNTVYQTIVDLGDGTYAVRLGGNEYFRVDADLPTTDGWSKTLIYAGLGVEDSLWVALVEKAYTHYRTGANTYASIEGGLGNEALAGLNASNVGYDYTANYTSGQAVLDEVASLLDVGKAVTFDVLAVAPGAPVVGNHTYTAVGVNRDATGNVISVTLRNPWGPSGADACVTLTGAELRASDFLFCWGDVV
jgi:hypothetical protein